MACSAASLIYVLALSVAELIADEIEDESSWSAEEGVLFEDSASDSGA